MRQEEGQSFAALVREELVRSPLGKNCCMLSEIAALTQTSGHLVFRGGGRLAVHYRLNSAGTARRLLLLLRRRLQVNPVLHFSQSGAGGQKTCVLTLEEGDTHTLLTALRMLETDEAGRTHYRRAMPRHPLTRQCCRRAYFRASFLGAGTVSHPERGYHLEWSAEDEGLPQYLKRLMEKEELPYHAYERKGRTVVYLKDAQQIADMLVRMGAAQNALRMEDARIHKQLRAAAVRAANCDEHNSEKMLDAGQRQAEACRQVSLKRGLFTLPPALREMARLRMEHPEMSLEDLGKLADPPLSKSAVNHRLRRLMAMANEV